MDEEIISYEEQLSTDEWALKRQEILKRDHYKCSHCGKERSRFRNIKKSFGFNSVSDMEKKEYLLINAIPTSYKELKFKKGNNEIEVNFIGDTNAEIRLCDLRFGLQINSLVHEVLGKITGWNIIAFYPAMHKNEIMIDHNIHHKYYITGRKAWEYDDDALVTLCVNCHKETHNTTVIFTYSEKGEKLYLNEVCGRCGGSGYFDEYKHVQNGRCFECFGEGVTHTAEK